MLGHAGPCWAMLGPSPGEDPKDLRGLYDERRFCHSRGRRGTSDAKCVMRFQELRRRRSRKAKRKVLFPSLWAAPTCLGTRQACPVGRPHRHSRCHLDRPPWTSGKHICGTASTLESTGCNAGHNIVDSGQYGPGAFGRGVHAAAYRKLDHARELGRGLSK